MTNITTAVIGCGYWGPNIIRNITNISNLKYVCDVKPELAQAEASKYDGVKVADLEVILSDPQVDAVAIVTPPSTHLELTEKCLAAGKHVFVEKPLAASAKESQELLKLSKTFSHLVCCVGHIFVFSPEIVLLKKSIDQGEIGNIKAITIERKNWGKFQSCGVEMDLLPHDLSIIQFLTGEPPTLKARTCLVPDDLSVAGSSSYELPSGITALVSYSWVHTTKVRKLSVFGTKGVMEYDMSVPKQLALWGLRTVGDNSSGHYQTIEVRDHSEPLREELQCWVDMISGNRPTSDNPISFAHGHAVVKAIGG